MLSAGIKVSNVKLAEHTETGKLLHKVDSGSILPKTTKKA